MVDALIQSLPIAIGLIIVSLPIAVVVLVLVSAGEHRPVAAFLTGWIAGIAGLSALTIAVVDVSAEQAGDDRSWWANILRILVGVVALGLAAKSWFERPKGDAEPPMPKWMSAFESISPRKAGMLSFAMVTANPKNSVMVISGATTIAAASEVVVHQVAAVAVFAMIATLGVAAPVIATVLFRDRASTALNATKDLMIRHDKLIMAAVLSIIGVVLIVNGLAEL